MIKIKSENLMKLEKLSILVLLVFIAINAYIQKDSLIALISAICGITYTFLAGKGLPICYLFGMTGSGFYSYLAFQNAIWGNLLLYLLYYIPMQITGYFKWKKHLKSDSQEIIKIKLPTKELVLLILLLFLLSIIVYVILNYYKDPHPILDSLTTVFSIGGMYLTVRRAIEQWIFWMFVNAISFIMWINLAINGAKVYSTIIMWGVYLFLAVYFYLNWRNELRGKSL